MRNDLRKLKEMSVYVSTVGGDDDDDDDVGMATAVNC